MERILLAAVVLCLGCASLAAQSDRGDLPPRPIGRDERGEREPFPPPPREAADDGLFPAILTPSTRGPGTWPLVNSEDRDDNRAPQYRVWWYPERNVRRTATHLGFLEHLLEVPFPIVLSDPVILAGSFRLRNLNFQTNAVLPDSQRPFPANLWDVSLGFAFLYKFQDGSTFGFLPRVGSPSDRPFSNAQVYNFTAIAFYRTPAFLEGDFWNFGLFYFPNSQIPFPFPGLSYEYKPNDDLLIRIGIPFSLMWRPLPSWKVKLDYRPLTQITSRLSYEVREGFVLYGGFDWDNQGYFLKDRRERRDLFFRQEKRILGGVRADIAERLTLDISGGYAFDRNFGSGRNALNLRYDKIDIASGGFLSAWLLIPF